MVVGQPPTPPEQKDTRQMSTMSTTDLLVRSYDELRDQTGAAVSADRAAIWGELRDLGWSREEVRDMLEPDAVVVTVAPSHSSTYYGVRSVARGIVQVFKAAVCVFALWAFIVLAWSVVN